MKPHKYLAIYCLYDEKDNLNCIQLSDFLEQTLDKQRSSLHFLPNRKKSFSIFLSPAGMSLTKLSLGGNNDVIYKLFLLRESLISEIPGEDRNIEKLFLQCIVIEFRLQNFTFWKKKSCLTLKWQLRFLFWRCMCRFIDSFPT